MLPTLDSNNNKRIQKNKDEFKRSTQLFANICGIRTGQLIGYEDGQKKLLSTKNSAIKNIINRVIAKKKLTSSSSSLSKQMAHSYLSQPIENVMKISGIKLRRHSAYEETLFYTNDCRSEYLVVGCDVDIQKKSNMTGSVEGIKEFYDILRDKFPELLFHEDESTSQPAGHCYLVFKNHTYQKNQQTGQTFGDAKAINEILKKTEKVFRYLAKDCDIADVEIKATCTDIKFSRNGYPESVKGGDLFKCPRHKHVYLAIQEQIEADKESEDENDTDYVMYLSDWADVIDDFIEPAQILSVKNRSKTGSIGLDEKKFDLINNQIDYFSESMFEETMKTTSSANVVLEDWKCFLKILKFYYENPNKDESCPVAGIEWIWNWMFDNDYVSRKYNRNRVAVMTKELSRRSFINWIDENYVWHCGTEQGQAAKWKITDEVYSMILNDEQRDEKQKQQFEEKKQQDQAQKGKGIGSSILCKANISLFVKNAPVLPDSQVITKIDASTNTIFHLNSDEITHKMMALAA
ncbi:hypothetical protein Pla110_33240 [Polystyrenella longa]|uniref:Uncharacterized protein n=1 Tax=Polystyrenella longa TaxID=2528007 RepID=A0A518CQS5_9PLAN|nr:hypothetical protein [Polystyrenella longa]QDU81582.1 hypothetical protein Pla110_33240 [Polystyrenella longa]